MLDVPRRNTLPRTSEPRHIGRMWQTGISIMSLSDTKRVAWKAKIYSDSDHDRQRRVSVTISHRYMYTISAIGGTRFINLTQNLRPRSIGLRTIGATSCHTNSNWTFEGPSTTVQVAADRAVSMCKDKDLQNRHWFWD